MSKIRKEDALNYHTQNQPGKIEVVPTKILSSPMDLALAYSPGVAEPCKEIARFDGDIQANTAVNTELLEELYPFSDLAEKGANTFIFSNLVSGNIAYKLVTELGGAEAIGPILLGMNKPVHILQLGSSVREIVNMVAIAVVDAQISNPI